MSKIIVLSLDGTMDSLATRPTHIANIQELLGGEHYLSRVTLMNHRAQGWQIQYFFDTTEHQKAVKPFMVTYYDEGLGAPHLDRHGKIDKWSVRPLQFAKKLHNTFEEFGEAAFADGITNNVAQAYKFLAQYYKPGTTDKDGNIVDPADQVYCLGFSRGSYTARLLSTMIRSIGLINTRSQAFNETYGTDIEQAIADGFECYRHGIHPDENRKAQAFKQKFCHDGKHLIHFMGLFEPVKGWIVECVPKDNRIGHVPKHVRQALAIDEARNQFHPAIGIPSNESSTMSAWFPGAHADVGGGYNEHNLLSNTSLRWMLEEAMACGLPIDRQTLNRRYPIDYFSHQHNSMYDTVPFSGEMLRWKNVSSTQPREIAVKALGETIHPSAFHRFAKEVLIQNENGHFEQRPYIPGNLVRAFEQLNNPQSYPTACSTLLFNYQHGYKVPEKLPIDENDIQKELSQEAEVAALRNKRLPNYHK